MKENVKSYFIWYVIEPLNKAKASIKEAFRKSVIFLRDIFDRRPDWLWDKRKRKELLVDVPEAKHRIYEAVLDNQYRHEQKDTTLPGSTVSEKMDSPKIVKLILDNLSPLFDIVGVQPMDGPVGLTYYMKYTTKEDKSLRLEILKQAIEAKTRQLQTRFTIEAAQDMSALHEIDIAKELRLAVAAEIATEIIAEQLGNVTKLAEKVSSNVTDTDKIMIEINRISNDIAHKTRRGAGNKIVISAPMLSLLISATSSNFKKSDNPAKLSDSGLNFVGVINKTTDVYVNIFAEDENKVLIGYKGSSDVDAGYIFSPYVMLLSAGIIVDPKTYEPQIGLMTRGGEMYQENVNDYYKELTFENELSFVG